MDLEFLLGYENNGETNIEQMTENLKVLLMPWNYYKVDNNNIKTINESKTSANML